MTDSTENKDFVFRAMTDDGAFRIMTIRSTQTVRDAAATQDAVATSLVQLGEAITSAVLVRETMAPPNRVQVQLRNKAGDQIVGDAFPEGKTRGLVRVQDTTMGVRFDSGGHLQVSRSMNNKPPHEGVVEVGANESVGTALATYFKQSEQVESMVGIASVIKDGEVVAAGG